MRAFFWSQAFLTASLEVRCPPLDGVLRTADAATDPRSADAARNSSDRRLVPAKPGNPLPGDVARPGVMSGTFAPIVWLFARCWPVMLVVVCPWMPKPASWVRTATKEVNQT